MSCQEEFFPCPVGGGKIISSSGFLLWVCAQSCLTLCNPMDYSLPGFSVHGISQARILEHVAISYSRGSSRPRDQTCVSRGSCFARGFFLLGNCFLLLHTWNEHSSGMAHLPECPVSKCWTPTPKKILFQSNLISFFVFVWSSTQGRYPRGGHGNPLKYSCLENPMNRGAWCHKESGHDWSDLACTKIYPIPNVTSFPGICFK